MQTWKRLYIQWLYWSHVLSLKALSLENNNYHFLCDFNVMKSWKGGDHDVQLCREKRLNGGYMWEQQSIVRLLLNPQLQVTCLVYILFNLIIPYLEAWYFFFLSAKLAQAINIISQGRVFLLFHILCWFFSAYSYLWSPLVSILALESVIFIYAFH